MRSARGDPARDRRGRCSDRSFALSLREVTREAGIVPAAFYRHFESMEALGLVLIDESFRALRDMLRGARRQAGPDRVIESSVDILIAGVNERREHWRFIGRERSSGVTVLRYAIRTEIRLILENNWRSTWPAFPAAGHLEQRGPQHPGQPVRQLDDRHRRGHRGRQDAGGAGRDQAHRRQTTADDHRRRHRLAQRRLNKVCG